MENQQPRRRHAPRSFQARARRLNDLPQAQESGPDDALPPRWWGVFGALLPLSSREAAALKAALELGIRRSGELSEMARRFSRLEDRFTTPAALSDTLSTLRHFLATGNTKDPPRLAEWRKNQLARLDAVAGTSDEPEAP